MKRILSIVAVVVVVGVGVFWYLRDVDPTGTPSPSPTAQIPGVRLYTSDELGIQFQYLEQQPGWGETKVQRIGAKVYIAVADTKPEAGQFVQMFTKRADESFTDAIRRLILADYPSPECTIEVAPSNIQGGYLTAEIGYPPAEGPESPYWENATMCNEQYARANGIRYFLYDPAHPTVFAFVDVGQYAIFGHDEIPWQYSITFLP